MSEEATNNVQEIQQEVDVAPEANESAQTLSFDELLVFFHSSYSRSYIPFWLFASFHSRNFHKWFTTPFIYTSITNHHCINTRRWF